MSDLKTEYKDFWQLTLKRERFHRDLELWDKKLSHLDNEKLYYILMRTESILNYRAEMDRQNNLVKGIRKVERI